MWKETPLGICIVTSGNRSRERWETGVDTKSLSVYDSWNFRIISSCYFRVFKYLNNSFKGRENFIESDGRDSSLVPESLKWSAAPPPSSGELRLGSETESQGSPRGSESWIWTFQGWIEKYLYVCLCVPVRRCLYMCICFKYCFFPKFGLLLWSVCYIITMPRYEADATNVWTPQKGILNNQHKHLNHSLRIFSR